MFGIRRSLLKNTIQLFVNVKSEELTEKRYVIPVSVSDNGSPNRSSTSIVLVDFKDGVQVPVIKAENDVKTSFIIVLSCLSGVLVLVIAVLTLVICRKLVEWVKNRKFFIIIISIIPIDCY